MLVPKRQLMQVTWMLPRCYHRKAMLPLTELSGRLT